MREARARQDGKPLSDDDRKALRTLGLNTDADRKILRARYAELVRKYHPDRNGGDRSHEKALQDVISAYTQLRKAPAFAYFLDARSEERRVGKVCVSTLSSWCLTYQ